MGISAAVLEAEAAAQEAIPGSPRMPQSAKRLCDVWVGEAGNVQDALDGDWLRCSARGAEAAILCGAALGASTSYFGDAGLGLAWLER